MESTFAVFVGIIVACPCRVSSQTTIEPAANFSVYCSDAAPNALLPDALNCTYYFNCSYSENIAVPCPDDEPYFDPYRQPPSCQSLQNLTCERQSDCYVTTDECASQKTTAIESAATSASTPPGLGQEPPTESNTALPPSFETTPSLETETMSGAVEVTLETESTHAPSVPATSASIPGLGQEPPLENNTALPPSFETTPSLVTNIPTYQIASVCHVELHSRCSSVTADQGAFICVNGTFVGINETSTDQCAYLGVLSVDTCSLSNFTAFPANNFTLTSLTEFTREFFQPNAVIVAVTTCSLNINVTTALEASYVHAPIGDYDVELAAVLLLGWNSSSPILWNRSRFSRDLCDTNTTTTTATAPKSLQLCVDVTDYLDTTYVTVTETQCLGECTI